MFTAIVNPLLASAPDGPDQRRALELLRSWDGVAADESAAAALAVLIWTELDEDEKAGKPLEVVSALREACAFLRDHFGKVEVPLGELQRLRCGKVDLPLGGAPTCSMPPLQSSRTGI